MLLGFVVGVFMVQRVWFAELLENIEGVNVAWATSQTHLEEQIPFNPELHNELAIDTCVGNFSGAVLQALAASTPKIRPRDDPRPLIPAGIQDEIRLKNRLRRRWQVTRDPALKAEVNRLQRL